MAGEIIAGQLWTFSTVSTRISHAPRWLSAAQTEQRPHFVGRSFRAMLLMASVEILRYDCTVHLTSLLA
jgi:hypothetical protein